MSEVILSASGLARTVGTRLLWRDFSLELRGGESVGVAGPSGSGKTVLLRTLAGLDPLEAGEVLFEGRSQDDWPMPQYRARVCYLSQRPVLFDGTVLDNLRRPFALHVHRHRRFDPDRAERLLKALGRASDFAELAASNLSGGEAQVMALTRTLLLDPRVLLLDEATASLDPTTTAKAEALLAEWLAGGADRACLWVGHDPVQRGRVTTREVVIPPLYEVRT